MDNDDNKVTNRTVQYLRMIQNVIGRLANNSKHIKAQAVFVFIAVTVLICISADPHWVISVGGSAALFCLWLIDARYLFTERSFRELYNATLENDGEPNYKLDGFKYSNRVQPLKKIFWTWSVSLFYAPMLLTVIGLSIFS